MLVQTAVAGSGDVATPFEHADNGCRELSSSEDSEDDPSTESAHDSNKPAAADGEQQQAAPAPAAEWDDARVASMTSAQHTCLLHDLCARGDVRGLHRALHAIVKLAPERREQPLDTTAEQPTSEDIKEPAPGEKQQKQESEEWKDLIALCPPLFGFHLDKNFVAVGRNAHLPCM